MAFAVTPKTDCPHIDDHYNKSIAISTILSANKVPSCKSCDDKKENWVCLHCYDLNCSRYVNEHSSKHFEDTKHAIAVSLSDLSVWCYSCESYIKSPVFTQLLNDIYAIKEKSIWLNKQQQEESDSDDTDFEKKNKAEAESSDEEEGSLGGIPIGLLKQFLGLEVNQDKEEEKCLLGEDLTVEAVAKAILDGKCKNIIVMTGAGISVAAGIPDFRSPGTGLYDNLQKYNLPHPTAVFELDYFKNKPEPFYLLAKELYPGNFLPTKTHWFIKLLADKGVLLRNFTQNIDTLERRTGIADEKLVEAHGSFAACHCIDCKAEASLEVVKNHVFSSTIPRCAHCNGLVKPDIIFFGESLPSRFFERMTLDFPKCDLLIVIGTSLQVHPFASLVDKVNSTTPRLLINNEEVGKVDPKLAMLGYSRGFRFGSPNNYRDIGVIGDCQKGIEHFADLLGWTDDLNKLIAGGPVDIAK